MNTQGKIEALETAAAIMAQIETQAAAHAVVELQRSAGRLRTLAQRDAAERVNDDAMLAEGLRCSPPRTLTWTITIEASADLVADGFDVANQIDGLDGGGELASLGRIVDRVEPSHCKVRIVKAPALAEILAVGGRPNLSGHAEVIACDLLALSKRHGSQGAMEASAAIASLKWAALPRRDADAVRTIGIVECERRGLLCLDPSPVQSDWCRPHVLPLGRAVLARLETR